MIRRIKGLLLVVIISLYANYWALAQQIEVPNRVRTSSSAFQDSVDFAVRIFDMKKIGPIDLVKYLLLKYMTYEL